MPGFFGSWLSTVAVLRTQLPRRRPNAKDLRLSLASMGVKFTVSWTPAMYSNPQKLSSREVLELRRVAGRWLKSLREQRGFSQRQVAAAIGAEYCTFISQIEAGRGRIPPDRYGAWAETLGIEPKALVRTLLRYYDPVTYTALFGEENLEIAPSLPGDVRSPVL
jgi:transcriptional regulator with XRE-family HTH domain